MLNAHLKTHHVLISFLKILIETLGSRFNRFEEFRKHLLHEFHTTVHQLYDGANKVLRGGGLSVLHLKPALVSRLTLSFDSSKFLNRSNRGTRGDIAEELAAVLKALWSGHYRSISCKDFKVWSNELFYLNSYSNQLMSYRMQWVNTSRLSVATNSRIRTSS